MTTSTIKARARRAAERIATIVAEVARADGEAPAILCEIGTSLRTLDAVTILHVMTT